VSVHANMEPIEGSLNGQTSHTFTLKSREIIIFNDSSSDDLQFKFIESADYATIKPAENVILAIWATKIFLSTSASVDYRVWVFG